MRPMKDFAAQQRSKKKMNNVKGGNIHCNVLRFFLVFHLLLFGSKVGFGQSDGTTAKIKLIVSPQLINDSIRVYWFGSGNDEYGDIHYCYDSCRLETNRTEYVLQGRFENPEHDTWLTFSDLGPRMASIIVQPGDYITVFVDETTNGCAKTQGSPATEELYELEQLHKTTIRQADSLQSILWSIGNHKKQKSRILEIRIDSIRNAYYSARETLAAKTNSALVFKNLTPISRDKLRKMPPEERTRLRDEFEKRFPNSKLHTYDLEYRDTHPIVEENIEQLKTRALYNRIANRSSSRSYCLTRELTQEQKKRIAQ